MANAGRSEGSIAGKSVDLCACGSALISILVLGAALAPATRAQSSQTQFVNPATDASLPDAPVPHIPEEPVAQNRAPSGPAQPIPSRPGAPPIEVYQPMAGEQRLQWIFDATLGPANLAAGVVVAGATTAMNRPPEYGTGISGFGERYGMRLAGLGTSNVMEAGVGSLWDENPRYRREPERSFGGRVKSVIVQTVETRKRDGAFSPAYARFIAIPGSNFLSNTWRPDSEADSYHAGLRTLEGFGGKLAGNAWDEFWPDVKTHLFHHQRRDLE